MKAKKENKVYMINTEQEKRRYLKEGYDIYDDEGKVAEYSPSKKIAYSEYVKAAREIERLKVALAEKNAETEALRAARQETKPSEKKAENKKAGE